jgi:hypothetical protein
MDWDALVVRPGDRVTGWGRLVRNAQGTWFDPPVPVPLIMIHPRSVAKPSPGAVPVTGADFAAAADRYELSGDVEGWATVTGVWTGTELRIERQSRGRPGADRWPRWDTPPCPPPSGGWPHGMNGRQRDNLDVDLGDLKETGAAVTVVTFRPGADQAVLVVAAARMLPQIATWAATLPPGILSLDPWLVPARAAA